jgi:hypothetical protein
MFEGEKSGSVPLRCSICGQTLASDPDDQPTWPGGPMDGECYRAREFDQTIWELEFTAEDEGGVEDEL